ncbi:M3 family metallopeptidase [Microbacterium imperiale]|uniref:Peptidyl-dipeptidase Dcp n=1 Tax=Microbacterium imperiale TaxID=33884 RepID=A0A9W6HFL0_9MICO|nr:M3 family metallopeptidase [Microbacterium imperiale]MBP2419502.1 peptidyl-dipeptidase Dcp [Microbacterium imperiale]MDS0198629.1 M3 family metallopeptidase [Microbacterium imperiale]BFE39845.1 M3 family metallopeptidase [Microbacterium imperiale]GLJ79180.1 peptidyl-dipeptidase Dcp [Microbacterium imperiale]
MTDPHNPLLGASTMPHGLPDYRAIRPEHYLPAFQVAFEEQRSEIQAIATDDAAPTFANTIEAWERSGRLLAHVAHTFFTVSSADATPEIQRIDEELAPLMSAHSDGILLDGRLYDRVRRVHDDLAHSDLTPEQRYLVERRFVQMTHAGAALDDEAKARLTEMNSRLSVLTTTFEKNLLADTNELAVVFDDVADLDGLGEGEVSAAARAAADRGMPGRFVVTLTLFTGHPLLASLRRRASRERVLEASRLRGSRPGQHDNRPVLLEIVRLRAERAALLGFASHAAYVTSDQTAGDPRVVADLLRRLATPAARNAQREKSELVRIAAQEAPLPEGIGAADWAFYTEKVRAATFDIDTAALRPWFEAERVLHDGVFYAATRLYGITFRERADLPAYHPQARVFEVSDADGSHLGLYILDLYTRDSKRGGAWMNSIVSQSHLRGTTPIVVNNLNVPQPAPGTPTLLTLDEVTTLFHEFGHALHGLFATVTYPSFAGTNVFRDFVEFPSQVNEMWIFRPEILANYARHIETGEPLPASIVERLEASSAFNQGFATSEYLAAAWLDLAWHSLSVDEARSVADVAAFEAAALRDIGLDDPAVPTRYSSTYFAHVFSGGYSAGYYSYIWSEVLDADTVEWFDENGGLERANGDRFRERLLGVGGSKDPLEAYRDFRGRDARIEPLLARRGLGV